MIKAQIEALAQQMHRTALELRDSGVAQPSWPQRRADALVELARRVAIQQAVPKHGGDRPHVVVLIDYEDLLSDCRGAGLADGTQLTAGQLRQFACDAGILPIILGGPSGVLDVGKEQRLVTPDIRHALHVRDKVVCFRVATGPLQIATRTTSNRGPKAARHHCRICVCCANTTTTCSSPTRNGQQSCSGSFKSQPTGFRK